jgi:coenzyme F420-0:L-glutamate ligase / coenzyme F420-1:gamma-L-glutamate ligase
VNRPGEVVLRASERRFLVSHRVAHLATADERGRPHVVPVCFVVAGDQIFIPLDEKPKSVAPGALRRVRNLLAQPEVALVVDDYSDDWEQLAYLLIRGTGDLIEPADPEHAEVVRQLREKYPQYQTMRLDERPIIRIIIQSARAWSMSGQGFAE